MSVMKERAQEILNELHQGGKLEYLLYSDLMDAVQEIEPLRDRDEELEEMWSLFADVPVNPETECIEEPFAGWGAGISREEIWHWFDVRYSKGIAVLLYGDGADRTSALASLAYANAMCFECESRSCAYNNGGECRFPLVRNRKPIITEKDGCTEGVVPPQPF